MWHRRVECLALAVDVRSRLPAIAHALSATFRTYADTAREPDLRYDLHRTTWPQLERNGLPVLQRDQDIDLVPALELDLYGQVIARAVGIAVHAASVVGPSGRALVFPGVSGAGKSTLVRALLERGLSYLSEECVALVAGRRCWGLARSLHVDDPSVPLPVGFTSDDYVLRNRKTPLHTRLFHPSSHQVWRGEAETAAVVVLAHAPDASGDLVRCSSGAALAALWSTVFRRDLASLDDAARGIDGVPVFQLNTRTPEQAVLCALKLAREFGVVG